MSWRRSQFVRDFRDLHGDETVIEGNWREAALHRPRMRFSEAVARVSIGLIGLFFVIVLGCALLGGIIVLGAVVAALI